MATNTKEFRVKNGLEISSGPIKINGSSGSSGQVLSSTGSGVQWVAPTTGSGTGDVVGPASSTINAVVRFDGTTGKLIKNSSGVTIDDSSNITTSGSLTVSGNATFDTNTLFVDATNDRVGVGTVSPSYKLDVRGMARIQSSSGYNVLFETWNTNERVNFMNDAGTANISAVFRATDYAWQNGGGSDILKLDSSGNLGVGTSSPDGKLEVSGKLKVRGTTSANDLVQVWGVSGGSGSYSTLELIKTADTSGNFIFRGFTAGGTGTAPKIAFGNWSATPFDGAQMTLDTSSGNFGLGTNSPSAGLHISKAFGSQLRIQETGGTYFDIACGGRFDIKNGSGTTIVSIAQSGSPVGTMLNLDSSGNLGLGSTNPVYKMQIEPTSVTAGGVNNLLRIGTQSTTAGTTSRFSMFCSTDPVSDANGGKVFIDAIRTATNMDLAFSLNNTGGAAPVERMRLTGEGNLGIGTSSPISKFVVNGNANVVGGSSLYFNLDSGPTAHGQLFDDGNFHIHSINSSAMWINSPNGTGVYINNQATGNVILTSSGSVGIGTAGPSAKLDVVGTNFSIRPSSVNGIGHFNVTNEIGSPISTRLAFGTDNTGWQMRFAKNYQGTYTDYMTITDGGNVGIATTSPAYKLDVNGNARTTGRFYSNEWVQFDNYTGIYSPINSAYIYPNPNSYGSWKVEGQRNGWCGFEFATTSNGNVSLMVQPNAGTVGFHNNSVGWQFRWNAGTLYCHKGTYGAGTEATVLDSSNYTSYALPLSGGTISGSIYATSNNSGGEFYSYGWFRNYNSGTGIYNQATGNHFYSDGGYWNVAYGGTQGIRFRNGHAGAILGYLYAETNGNIGLLSNNGNWSVRTLPSDAGITLYGTEVNVNQTLFVHEGANRTRVPRTFVQSSTPTGTITNGDVWLQY